MPNILPLLKLTRVERIYTSNFFKVVSTEDLEELLKYQQRQMLDNHKLVADAETKKDYERLALIHQLIKQRQLRVHYHKAELARRKELTN